MKSLRYAEDEAPLYYAWFLNRTEFLCCSPYPTHRAIWTIQ